MNKIAVQNLGMIITERCNLNCAHCLRGKCTNKIMNDDVITATLGQFCHIHNLAICGGEPTLALDRIEKIFSYIIENEILVDMVTLAINGTIYSEEFLKLLDYIEEYINYQKLERALSTFTISWDEFHYSEVERLGIEKEYLENIQRYKKNKHYYGMQRLTGKLFREGNAESLDSSLTMPMTPMMPHITYVGDKAKFDKENGLCNIGPIITVNVNGTITECDASITHQETLYNYGNVLTDSIEDIYLKKGILVLKPRIWLKKIGKEMIRYYNI